MENVDHMSLNGDPTREDGTAGHRVPEMAHAFKHTLIVPGNDQT